MPGMMGWRLERQQGAAKVACPPSAQRWANMKSYRCICHPGLLRLGRAREKAVRNFGEHKESVASGPGRWPPLVHSLIQRGF